ncbi:DUF4232 domain-containing protein [Peterkaempfera bronchialis]|uniref:DUF4232 domain-containing protein n=1 Tax=Peterkaempfera bronchialis TaxID=2126346 RepID=UPI003C2EF756
MPTRALRTLPALPALLAAAALLLTACGSRSADAPGSGVRPTAGSASPDLPGDPADLERDGVRITGVSGWSPAGSLSSITTEFQVTNHERRPFTYTITFNVLADSGAAVGSGTQTVPSVGPGRTVTRTIRMDAMDARDHGRLRVTKVRRVPSDEVPTLSGPCPPSGVRVRADDGDAAMGLRVVGLHLENCGTRAFPVDGYPLLGLLDEDRKPVSGVRVLHGSGGIATMSDFDAPPRPLTLEPGETASAGLLWRNTTEAGTPVNAPYVRVRATPGAPPVTVTPELDLGTTGRLGVSAWKKDPPR